MAAKAALLAVLADSSLTEKDMVSSALTTARQYKLGVLPLRKLLDEMTNSQGKKPVETVEDAVMELVEHACGSSSIEKESSSKAAIADGDSKDHSTVHEPEVRDTRDSDHDHDPVDSASGLPKAKALAMAAIEQAQAQVQEQERTTADNDTVSTLTILTQLVQKLNEDRQESRNREARLQKTIGEMNSEIKKMTTLVAAQAGAAEDREARLKKKIHNLECTVSQLSESITEIMTNQINAAKENNENHQKLARKLNDIKTPSNPRQGKPEMTKPTPEKNKKYQSRNYRRKKERRKFSRPTSIKEYNPSRYSTNGRVHPKRDPPKFPSSRSSGKPMVIGCKKREIKNINGNYNPLARQNIGTETTAWNQPRSESCFFISAEFPPNAQLGTLKSTVPNEKFAYQTVVAYKLAVLEHAQRVCLLHRSTQRKQKCCPKTSGRSTYPFDHGSFQKMGK